MESTEVILARLEQKMDGLEDSVTRLSLQLSEMRSEFVSYTEFWPVKALVFGGAGAILLSVLGALVAMVVHAAT